MSTAIFGAGILGTCTALEIAGRGHPVTLFERNAEALSEASFHNEGKLHLGFVYAADRTLRTAERMIGGATQFMSVLGRWIPQADLRALTARPFDYAVHRETMVATTDIEAHFRCVADTLDRLGPKSSSVNAFDASRPAWRRLLPSELEARYDPRFVTSAYETCEIAIDAWGLARHLREALHAHPRVELVAGARVVTAVDRSGGGFDVVFDLQGPRPRGSVPRGRQCLVGEPTGHRPALRFANPRPSHQQAEARRELAFSRGPRNLVAISDARQRVNGPRTGRRHARPPRHPAAHAAGFGGRGCPFRQGRRSFHR